MKKKTIKQKLLKSSQDLSPSKLLKSNHPMVSTNSVEFNLKFVQNLAKFLNHLFFDSYLEPGHLDTWTPGLYIIFVFSCPKSSGFSLLAILCKHEHDFLQ